MSKKGINVLRELEKDGNAVHIEGLDVTLGVNNELIVLIQMLPILLTKLSCLPLVPDFTEVKGLSKEQAIMVQELNAQLIYAHGITQKYITQQYFVLVCIQKMMKEVISNIPETDMTHLLDYIRNYNELKHDKRNFQKGGLPNPFMKSLVYLFSIVSLFAPSAASSDLSTAVSLTGQPADFQRGIIHFNKDTFIKEVDQLSRIQSDEIDINTMVATVDAAKIAELKTLGGFISSLITSAPATGRQQLEEIISNLNEDSYHITKNITNTCMSLMGLASQNGIFDSKKFMSIKKIDEVKKDLESIPEVTWQSTCNDKICQVGNFLKDAYKLIANTDDTHEQQAIAAPQESKSLTYEEKEAFKGNLYQLSRVYCLNSYNLNFRLNSTSNTIELVGDKIPYNDMFNFIETVEKNIEVQISKLSGDNTDYLKLALESLQERLYVLKEISAYLYNIIGESKTTINGMNNMNTKKNPLNKLEASFKSNLNDLMTFATEALSALPRTERMNKEINKQLDAKNKHLQDEAVMMQTHHDIVKRSNMQELLKSFSPALESIESISGIMAKFIEVGTEGVAGVALAAPKAAVKASIDKLSELVPTSVLYGMGVFMILSIMAISGQIIMFTQSGQLMMAVVTFPFVCVYKLVVTPLGYVCKQVGSLFIGSSKSTSKNGLLTNTANNKAENIEFERNNANNESSANVLRIEYSNKSQTDNQSNDEKKIYEPLVGENTQKTKPPPPNTTPPSRRTNNLNTNTNTNPPPPNTNTNEERKPPPPPPPRTNNLNTNTNPPPPPPRTKHEERNPRTNTNTTPPQRTKNAERKQITIQDLINRRNTLHATETKQHSPKKSLLQVEVEKRRNQLGMDDDNDSDDSDNDWNDNSYKTGGKRRNYTRKHKITKTKKARRGKRRQTHYKKHRPTKRR